MKVIPHDHILRFRVVSETRAEIEHLVDLGAFDGFGRCSCESFEFRILPELEAGRSLPLPRCKHLDTARRHFLEEVISKIVAGDPSSYEPPA